jgi:pimeloyl-ACP methyl ester carboxylesterase
MICKELFLPMKFKDTNIKVHVLIYGPVDAEKQVLCLHGFASSGKVGYHNIAKHMKDYNLIVIDWIGYGLTSKPLGKQDTYDEEYMLSFLELFIKKAIKKNILRKKFNILATSMSGIAVALGHEWLKKYVDKIVLVNPAGFDRRINIKFSLLLVNPLIRRDNFRKRISQRIMKGELFGWKQDQKKRLATLLDSDEFKAYLRMVKAAIRPRGRIRNTHRCMNPEHIKIPLLMVVSSKDTLFKKQRYIRIAKRHKWKLVRIKYNDHALLIYRPKEVAEATKKFL